MTAPAQSIVCPRCTRAVLRDHDEFFCLVHGTVSVPHRAWDVAAGTNRTQMASPVWLPHERKAWEQDV